MSLDTKKYTRNETEALDADHRVAPAELPNTENFKDAEIFEQYLPWAAEANTRLMHFNTDLR